ncbi:MAG: SPOR domain-containing protein [Odoribacter sp.]|nr:SPOR domain-containing protein [Odoribacter sp.]
MIKKIHGYILQDKIRFINRQLKKQNIYKIIYSKEWAYSLFAICFLFACTQKDLNPKYLTTIPVERKIDKENTFNNGSLSLEQSEIIPQDTLIIPPKDTLKQEDKKYHIIVASFGRSQRRDAETLKNDLLRQGYSATLIEAQGRLRISIESFKTEAQALNKLDYYINETRIPDIWVLKYP